MTQGKGAAILDTPGAELVLSPRTAQPLYLALGLSWPSLAAPIAAALKGRSLCSSHGWVIPGDPEFNKH